MISRLARHLPLRLAFFCVLAALFVWPVLSQAAQMNEFRDVHHLFLYERSAIDTIRRYGELPLWNPYYCGGFDAVGAPQTRFVSPTLLLGPDTVRTPARALGPTLSRWRPFRPEFPRHFPPKIVEQPLRAGP